MKLTTIITVAMFANALLAKESLSTNVKTDDIKAINHSILNIGSIKTEKLDKSISTEVKAGSISGDRAELSIGSVKIENSHGDYKTEVNIGDVKANRNSITKIGVIEHESKREKFRNKNKDINNIGVVTVEKGAKVDIENQVNPSSYDRMQARNKIKYCEDGIDIRGRKWNYTSEEKFKNAKGKNVGNIRVEKDAKYKKLRNIIDTDKKRRKYKTLDDDDDDDDDD